MTQPLIKTEIKGRDIVFYLTSKNDLDAIKSKNIFADIFLVLFSLAVGGLLSIFLAKELSDNLSSDIIRRLNTIAILLAIVSIAFLAFYIVFTVQGFKAINGIISSGKVTSINIETDKTDTAKPSTILSAGQLKIIEALYYTDKGSFDPTQKLQSLIKDNVLETFANNDLVGDPHPGVPKKLRLKYSFDNVVYIKEYNEGDPIHLP